MEVPIAGKKAKKISTKVVVGVATSLYVLSALGLSLGITLNDTLKASVWTEMAEQQGGSLDNENSNNDNTGTGTPEPAENILTISGVNYSIKLDSNNLYAVSLPEYTLPVSPNGTQLSAIGAEATSTSNVPFESEHVGFSNYETGKEGFFRINYLNTGYVKIENNIVYGGYTSTSVDVLPTLPVGKERINYGAIVANNLYLNLTAINEENNSLTSSTYTIANLPLNIQADGRTNYYCLDKQATDLTNLFTTSLGDSPTTNSARYYCVGQETTTETTLSIAYDFLTGDIPSSPTSLPIPRTFDHSVSTNTLTISPRNLEITSLYLKIPTTNIIFMSHPLFGRIIVDDQDMYINPYDQTTNTLPGNGSVTFPAGDFSLDAIKAYLERNSIPFTSSQ